LGRERKAALLDREAQRSGITIRRVAARGIRADADAYQDIARLLALAAIWGASFACWLGAGPVLTATTRVLIAGAALSYCHATGSTCAAPLLA
jgi:hypothetical protein